jgi:hypothetical protein
MTLDELLELGMQIADALGPAHPRGIVRRGIKPSIGFGTVPGQATITDFGGKTSSGHPANHAGSQGMERLRPVRAEVMIPVPAPRIGTAA